MLADTRLAIVEELKRIGHHTKRIAHVLVAPVDAASCLVAELKVIRVCDESAIVTAVDLRLAERAVFLFKNRSFIRCSKRTGMGHI